LGQADLAGKDIGGPERNDPERRLVIERAFRDVVDRAVSSGRHDRIEAPASGRGPRDRQSLDMVKGLNDFAARPGITQSRQDPIKELARRAPALGLWIMNILVRNGCRHQFPSPAPHNWLGDLADPVGSFFHSLIADPISSQMRRPGTRQPHR
jgi:hypothetical protein